MRPPVTPTTGKFSAQGLGGGVHGCEPADAPTDHDASDAAQACTGIGGEAGALFIAGAHEGGSPVEARVQRKGVIARDAEGVLAPGSGHGINGLAPNGCRGIADGVSYACGCIAATATP